MEQKKYYAITTVMAFEKTVLVPVESVEDLDEAIDLVDMGVEVASIDLLNQEAECSTRAAMLTDENGITELSDEEAAFYQIVEGDRQSKDKRSAK